MHPGTFAKTDPNKVAIVTDAGREITYAALDARANQISRFLQSLGIAKADPVAILLPNDIEYLEIAWGIHRLGAQYVLLNHHLTAAEVDYILADCGASVLFTASAFGDPVRYFGGAPALRTVVMIDAEGEGDNCTPMSAIDAFSVEPLDFAIDGGPMLYSSGTTGRPKGIVIRRAYGEIGPNFPLKAMMDRFGMDADSVYLTPAPLYHAAPIMWSMSMHRIGATLVVMTKFDAERALQLIENQRVTHGQFVPTMFTRMLKLSDETRTSCDVSSLAGVIHSAAPCPASVKRAMIEWWGPIIWEFYGASEGHGSTMLNSEEWLSHPGSVGKPLFGQPHIVLEDGSEAPPNVVGDIYFSGGAQFTYHGDPDKTRDAYDERGWARVGDRGYLDEDGFLYLADRSNDMIISGGVNIYPRDSEDALALHPKVMDVAVIGVPNEEFGEEVKALVVLKDASDADPATEAELIAHCRSEIAHFKCPRSIDFVAELPRLPNGKLYRRRAREAYWKDSETLIV